MNRPVWGPFTWAWLYAFAHFAVVWILGVVYLRQADRCGSDGRIAPPEGCLRRGPVRAGRNAGGKETGFFRRFSGRKKTLPSLRKEAQTMNLTHLIFLAAIWSAS